MKLRLTEARRIILGAQGLRGDRDQVVTMRQVQTVINRLGQFQIDSVNVLTRAHTMPLYSRLGGYDPELLTRAATQAPRRLFEFWGHAASLIDINLYPLFEFRRANAYALTWGAIRRFVDSEKVLIEEIASAIHQYGPLTARQLGFGQDRRREHWGWNWSQAKAGLEWLFWCGRVAVVGRNAQFERIYDIPERVIPGPLLKACQPWETASTAERAELTKLAHLELVRRASRALGVATAGCLADYFRTAAAPTRAAITQLVAQGELIEVQVEGIRQPTWVWHEATGRRNAVTTLVSPFDSLVFERKRLARFFGTDYTISLYTPAAKRLHGYYVYLFLLNDNFVARTDLKAERATGTLAVQSAWLEPAAESIRSQVTAGLVEELRRLADWQGLSRIVVAPKGTLAPDLSAAFHPSLP